jgi:hypothetical protein
MRRTAARITGALLVGGTALSLAACSSGGGGESKATACDNMKKAITGYNAPAQSDLTAVAKAYTDTAAKIRTEATKVKDDKVKAAAGKVATALDSLAADMRTMAKGNVAPMNFQQFTGAVAELRSACPS